VDLTVNAHNRNAPVGEPVAADDDIDSGSRAARSHVARHATARMDQLPSRSYQDPNGGVSWAPAVEFASGAKKKRRRNSDAGRLKAVHAPEAGNAV